VFLTVTGLTVLFAIASAIVVYLPTKPESGQLFETFTTLVKLGFGAICGLVSGRALGATH